MNNYYEPELILSLLSLYGCTVLRVKSRELAFVWRWISNHVIGVVFQDQTMHSCTSFKGAKHATLRGERGVFLALFTNIGYSKHDGQIKKEPEKKNMYFGFVYPPGKYMLRVCYESLFRRMRSTLKCKSLPPLLVKLNQSHYFCSFEIVLIHRFT